jgi:hypothetical protein
MVRVVYFGTPTTQRKLWKSGPSLRWRSRGAPDQAWVATAARAQVGDFGQKRKKNGRWTREDQRCNRLKILALSPKLILPRAQWKEGKAGSAVMFPQRLGLAMCRWKSAGIGREDGKLWRAIARPDMDPSHSGRIGCNQMSRCRHKTAGSSGGLSTTRCDIAKEERQPCDIKRDERKHYAAIASHRPVLVSGGSVRLVSASARKT